MNEHLKVYCLDREVEGIVFDLDGTLIDSINTYFEVFRDAVAHVGIIVNREDVLDPMVTGSLIWDRAVPFGISNREEKIAKCMSVIPQIFAEAIKKVKVFPGVESVLRTLLGRNLKLGLVTNSRRPALHPIEEQEITHFFESIITSEDGFPQKPSPLALLECLRRLSVKPRNALSVGDSPLDIRAGNLAETLTIGVLSGIGNRQQLESERPIAVLSDVNDILNFLVL